MLRNGERPERRRRHDPDKLVSRQGFYYIDGSKHWILSFPYKGGPLRVSEVDPTTVGEYSDRDDYKGNKIFEHDIVRIGFCRNPKSIIFWYGIGVITCADGAFRVNGKPITEYKADARFEVIGNDVDHDPLTGKARR
jgi:hypothetical protein